MKVKIKSVSNKITLNYFVLILIEGLNGCKLNDLFNILYKSSIQNQTLLNEIKDLNESDLLNLNKLFEIIIENKDEFSKNCKNFVWNLIINQNDIDFYLEDKNSSSDSSLNNSLSKSTSKFKGNINNKLSFIINDGISRGHCVNYTKRKHIDIDEIKNKNINDLLKESETLNLIIVADQQLRNKVLCPSYKYLEFENLNDLEYCVLEAVARTRFNGIYSTGDSGLTQIFDLAPKQLHYILVILEAHQLIKKQVLSSEKKRSIIHLKRYAFKQQSMLENVCEYLISRNLKNGNGYFDTFSNIKSKIGITNKQFKTLVQSAEKQKILERYLAPIEWKFKKNKTSEKVYTKTRQIRMIKFTDSYIKTMLNNNNMLNHQEDEINDFNDSISLNDSEEISSSSHMSLSCLGAEQSNFFPLNSQIFSKIEQCGQEGISLKELGTMFGLDFYKSRRIGANLQSHPEIVTLMKETNRGKAKYQTIILRKYLSSNVTNATKSSSQIFNSTLTNNQADTSVGEENKSDNFVENSSNIFESDRIIFKKDTHSNKNIQAVVSDRSLMRKKIILDYLNKHRICTKYEITKEIRNYEQECGLKGCIDAKTTKRMLINLENEKKLNVFNVNLKNVSYMCVKSCDVCETDELYVNYCSTFKRTFDSVDLNYSKDGTLNTLTQHDESFQASPKKTINDDFEDKHNQSFRLTRSFINETVEKLKFTTNYCKVYALAPKFQKAIILHRFLQYLLFFYDGKPQSDENPDLKFSLEQQLYLSKTDSDIIDSFSLPPLDKTYKNTISWQTYIPPLNRSKLEDNCIFIGEIFSHMPLSIFCSIIVINHCVPGLVAILKHQHKRHILVKDLPPEIIAPLIYERRYLQRILAIMQLLGSLGLITFVESPCKTNQALNRDVQQQLIYVHRQAKFYDTTTNKAQDWNEHKLISSFNFEKKHIDLNNDTNLTTQRAKENYMIKYEECLFEFKRSENVVDYWQKLLHISMNTFKFSVTKYLHENKKLRQELLNKITSKIKLDEINPLWPIENFGDHLGPGCYDSQLFLNSFKNWMLPTNLGNNNSISVGLNTSRSKNKSSPSTEPAITKEDDQSFAPFSELALLFPFGVYRCLASSNNNTKSKYPMSIKKKIQKKSKENKVNSEDGEWKASSDDENYNEQNEMNKGDSQYNNSSFSSTKHKITDELNLTRANKKFKTDVVKYSPNTRKQQVNKSLKIFKAKSLVDKAKNFKVSFIQTKEQTHKTSLSSSNNSNICSNFDRRAIWHQDEDELILLIKVTALYFLPNEPSVPFKLIRDVQQQLMPAKCIDKKVSSFGRRIKMLLKSNMNKLFVNNKLELCKQDKELNKKYFQAKSKLKRNIIDREQVDLYVKFIGDIKEKYLKIRDYSNSEKTDSQNCVNQVDNSTQFDLPSTLEEFSKKYTINNTPKSLLFKNQTNYFQQPKTDYEISCSTLHSAIHSSILINDKNPRVYESFHLFDKYSDQLLTDVISKMSRQHKIIAPTKGSELKKKNVTAFSKHIGKAYHISQRYQYKWTNNISANVLDETKKFKDSLIELKKKMETKTDDNNINGMYDFTDRDDLGMTSFLAHTIDCSSIQVQIDVPNKIWYVYFF